MGDYASEEIYLLYRAGIACGNDKGYYQPNNSISRAEAFVVVSRNNKSDYKGKQNTEDISDF